jgi:uncharacterized integral membrane protein
MVRLITSAVILVILGILIILNLNNRSTINLFGARLENVSVIVIALVGFVLGILYSVALYITSRYAKRRKASSGKKAQRHSAKTSDPAAPEDTPQDLSGSAGLPKAPPL